MYEYKIGEKVYEQKPLVWGQAKQLTKLLKEISFGPETTVSDLIALIGDRMPMVLAIVLTEQGKSPKDKNLEALSEELAFDTPVDVVAKAIEDFFVCNPTASYLEKLEKLIGGARGQMEEKLKTLLKEPSSSSPAETLQKEIQ
jgi:hypothetical protein